MIPTNDKNIVDRFLAGPTWLFLSLMLFLLILSYSNTIYSPFVLDDFHSFVHNKAVYAKDISFASLKQLSSTSFGKSRLIPIITFAIDHHLSAGSIVQYHLTNITIHLLCTLALFFLLSGLLQATQSAKSLKIFSKTGFCLLATALWAFSPVQTNAVTYLVQRMTSIATLFYVSSLAFYIHGRLARSKRTEVFFFTSAMIMGIFSILSKENSYTLPFALFMIEFYFLSTDAIERTLKSMSVSKWLFLGVLVLLLLPLAQNFIQRIPGSFIARDFTLIERLLTEARVVVFYISLLLLPLPGRLNLEHDFLISEALFSPPSTFFAILLLILLLFIGFRIRKSYPLVSFGILWFYLNLAIESTFIPLEIIFEHRLYLSSIGFFICLTSLADHAAAKSVRSFPVADFKKNMVLVSILIISVSSILTTLRNNDWRDTEAFYSDIIKKSPNKPRPYNQLGLTLSRLGRKDEALVAFDKGLELDRLYGGDSLNMTNNVMVTLSEMDKIEEGIARGEEFIKSSQRVIDVTYMGEYLYNLGVLYERTDQYKYAFDAFLSSFIADDENDFVINVMGKLLWKYSDDPVIRQELGMNGNEQDKNIAVRVRLAEILYDFRKYERALSFLTEQGGQLENSREVVELSDRIKEDRKKNIARQKESSINNHQMFQQNSTYRISLKFADLIMKHYSPLLPFAGWLINETDERVPNDPFVSIYKTRWMLKNGQSDEALDVLSTTLASYPDFVPALDIYVGSLNRIESKEEIASVLKHILDIYPAHPKWKKYEKLIKMYGENNEEQKII